MKGTITFDFNNMLNENIGGYGIAQKETEENERKTPIVHAAMKEKLSGMAWRSLPYNQAEIIQRIIKLGKEINQNYKYFVVLGIGGSALGSKALFAACKHLKYNELSDEKRGGVKFYVEDNVDPDRMQSLFDVIDVKQTVFHVITKSGNTVETISQFMIVLDMLKKELGDNYKKNIIITTDKEKGNLKKIADEHAFETFVVPDGVGGRFSIFCPVGLLSAAVLNIDIEAMLCGAKDMDKICTKPSLWENPAYFYAFAYTAAMRRGVNISVLLPYADALQPTAEWYCQLWAESLGKRVDNSGNTVNFGQTPVRTIGVTDQHSQIQLYNEGPFDKIITFIEVENFKNTVEIPKIDINMYDADYLFNKTLNTLISAELSATIHAVTKNGKMNNKITISELNEYTFGALIFFFEMATAAAGEFLEIDAFNQPGVEEGKIATFALMGKPGYESERAELGSEKSSDQKYIYEL